MARSQAPSHRAPPARRFGWAYVVLGVVCLGLAAGWVVGKGDHWQLFAGVWTVIGLGWMLLGLRSRREDRRSRDPS